MKRPEAEKKDFVISYNSADRQWAEWIAWQLEKAGYDTVIQVWDFRPGSNFVLNMQRAAEQASHTIAVLSPNYLNSRYTRPEWAAAFAQDPAGEKGMLLPVRVEECDLKGLLSQVIYVDLVGLTEEAAREALLKGVEQGRAKPTSEPPFPGSAKRRIPERPSFPPELEKPANRQRPSASFLADVLGAFRDSDGPGTQGEEDAVKALVQLNLTSLEAERLAGSLDLRYLVRRSLERDPGLPVSERLRAEAENPGGGWPDPLWPPAQQEDHKLTRALEALGFQKNPFESRRAEEDSQLVDFFFDPECWDDFCSKSPLWVFGPSGAGRTAMALMLRYYCTTGPVRYPGAFPVYLVLKPFFSRRELARQILYAGIEELFDFLPLNPYGLLEHNEGNRTNMAALIRWRYPKVEVLEQRLDLKGVNLQRGSGRWLLDHLKGTMPAGNVEQRIENWLEHMLPHGYSDLYLLLEAKRRLNSEQADLLEELATRWYRGRVHFKILEKFKARAARDRIETIRLRVDVRQMLRRRIRRSSRHNEDSLGAFCSHDVSDPDDTLIKAADGSPGRLVKLGDQLIRAWARRTNGAGKITLEDFEKAGIIRG
jgi:hypothetical protein